METTAATPAFGLETIKWVLEAIKANPELHEQSAWETQTECGTALCVGGWAAFAHRDVFEAEVARCLTLYGPAEPDEYDMEDARDIAFFKTGQVTMGLTPMQADHLFYAGNGRAVEMLEALAAGKDWGDIYHF